MNKEVRCEKCGEIMKQYKKYGSIGMECPKCGWGWVTTNVDQINNDNILYTLKIKQNNNPSIDLIRIISKILNKNFLDSKNKIQNEDIEIKDLALEIKKYSNLLDENGIVYTIYPKFPY